jgi:hypothetical protein
VKAFTDADITLEPIPWPEDVDDAHADWNWTPDYDVDRFFGEYFLPEIRKRYGT